MRLNAQGNILVATQVSFMVIGTIFIGLCLAARHVNRRSFRWHDYCCIVAYLFMLAFNILTIISAFYGLGYHVTEVPPRDLVTVMKLFFTSVFVYNGAGVLMRLSILLLCLTLFQHRKFRYVTYGFAGFVVVLSSVSTLYLFGLCRPISKNWHPENPGKCGNVFVMGLFSACINLVLDLVLVLLPMPIVWWLKMPTRKKATVSSILCLSVVTAGINIGRILQLVVDKDYDDFTYFVPATCILASAEIVCVIGCCCIPTLGPLVRQHSHTDDTRFISSFVVRSKRAQCPAEDRSLRTGDSGDEASIDTGTVDRLQVGTDKYGFEDER